jgi:hypothetical protein
MFPLFPLTLVHQIFKKFLAIQALPKKCGHYRLMDFPIIFPSILFRGRGWPDKLNFL